MRRSQLVPLVVATALFMENTDSTVIATALCPAFGYETATAIVKKALNEKRAVVDVADDGAVAIPLILRTLDSAGVPLGTIELNRPSLDDVFLTKTGRSLRES